jgi:two-component system nitrogen regulation sensor histidine kinase NtrY
MKLSFGIKLRFLLFLLGCCLIITSISLHQFTSESELLEIEGKKIQANLNSIEEIVDNILNSKEEVAKLKQFHYQPKYGLEFLSEYSSKGIQLFTYQNKILKYWSTFKVGDINPDAIKEGTSVLFINNGWYEIIKKTVDDFAFIFLIDIHSEYQINENQFFKNELNPLLSETHNVSISSFNDKNVYVIKSSKNNFLFGLKLKPEINKTYTSTAEILLFVAGIVFILIFFNSLCVNIAKKGYPLWATFIFLSVFIIVRFTDLRYGWFNHRFDLNIFDPKVFSESFLLPSLGDFLLNVLAGTWFLLFVFNHKHLYQFNDKIAKSKIAAYIIEIFIILFVSFFAIYADDKFLSLILNSKINFDIINILNLGGNSWVSIVILCLVWFQLFLITTVAITLTQKLNTTISEKLTLFLILFIAFFIYKLVTDFTAFFIIYAFLILIFSREIYLKKSKFSIGLLALIFFLIAFNTSIKYIKYKDIKERTYRESLALRVQSNDDPNAIISLSRLENKLLTDPFIVQHFKSNSVGDYKILKAHLKDYMDGYLNRYNYKVFDYNSGGLAVNPEAEPISRYKNLVESGSVKIESSNYFYRINNTFGYQDYFCIIPIINKQELIGTLVLEFRSKPYNYNNRLPDLLSDTKQNTEEEFKDYSIALFMDNKLLNQSGQFTYSTDGKIYKGKLQEFVSQNDRNLMVNHMIYKPSKSKMIVISKEKAKYIDRLAALSFFFLVFIIFSFVLYALVWAIKNIGDDNVGWFTINRSLMINANKILYKTRIQFSIILSVVATLLIVGWTTYFYMEKEYFKEQEVQLSDKIKKIQQNFEKQIFNSGNISTDETSVVNFNNFADLNNADLNLFDTNGTLLITTVPKIFSNKIIGRKMNPKAFIYINEMQRSDYINTQEKIGRLTYSAAYAPIRNSQNKTIAYIGLPNYSNEAEYRNKIGLFVSNLINIYALVFVGIGVLSVFLANQITSPLTFIQENISKTKLGQKNEPIVWRRHDEIGTLIREYNNMIAALEESTNKLAKSERESAWREMAKQVAHEIKNPLTPLKLGVQLLEKSWKENDPNFEKKFNKFSKSFIEQIESLSKIASEFSDFAKMPDTNLEKMQLLPVLDQAREVFSSSNVEINTINNIEGNSFIFADRDQLLRSFNNLFKNAIEASSDVNKCIITVIINNDTNFVYVEIKDNGIGIPDLLQNKIFVPNFTTKSSGTGLGLAFVKQAVENAGGSVAFSSSANNGTTFYLKFPQV